MKIIIKYERIVAVLLVAFLLSGCEDFLDLEVPNDRITSTTVYDDDATALTDDDVMMVMPPR